MSAAASTIFAAENKYAPLAYQPLCSFGRALVDVEVARHPELKILTVHVTPRGVSKMDAGPDAQVYQSNRELVEIEKDPSPASTNFSITATPKDEVLEILRDRAGNRIGLVVMVFPYHENFDLKQYHKIALQVAQELSERISSKDGLFDPA